MGKYSDQLLGGGSPAEPTGPAVAPALAATPQRKKYSDMLLQSPGQEPQERIEPKSSAAHAAGLGDIAVASLADDPAARAKFFAQKRGLPLDRYRVVEGRVAYQDDDGEWYLERPNAVLSDPRTWFQSAAGGLGPSFPAVGGTAAGIAALPFGLMPSVPAAAAGGAAGQAVREGLAAKYVGQESPPSHIASRMAQQAALEASGQGIGAGLTAWARRGIAPDIAKLNRPAATALAGRATARGIQLTPAEATDLTSLKTEQKALGNLPGSADTMSEFYEKRAGQVAGAVEQELGRIAPPGTGAEVAGLTARAGSREAMAAAARNRSAQASPLYQQAFSQAGDVDILPTLQYAKNASRMFPKGGQVQRALDKAYNLLTREVKAPHGTTRVPELNLERLHNAKLEIDQMLEATGENSLGRTTKAKLTELKERLLTAMDQTSPTYGNARALFADLSPGVERVREGVLGIIADLPEHRLQTAATRLFSATSIAPQEVRAAARELKAYDPASWQQIKRAWLDEQWQKAGKETLAGGPKANQGALWRKALVGDPKQRANLEAMLEPGERKSLYELLDILRATGSVKPIGSDTAWNQEAMKALRYKTEPWIAKALRYSTPRGIREQLTDRAVFNNSERMAEAITAPGAMDRLRELRRLPASAAVKRVLLGHLLMQGGKMGAETVLQPPGTVEKVGGGAEPNVPFPPASEPAPGPVSSVEQNRAMIQGLLRRPMTGPGPMQPPPGAAEMAVGMLPGAGDVMAAQESQRAGQRMVSAFRAGDYGAAAGAGLEALGQGLGALPIFPAMVKAYHGSPHRFDKFSMEKIGTGEGAQAYGHGLYFAENPGVAGSYKTAGRGAFGGTAPTITLDGKPVDWAAVGDSTPEGIALSAIDDPLVGGNVVEKAASLRKHGMGEAAEWLEKNHSRVGHNSGALYNVSLDVEPEDLLDWDAPLSQQSEKVRKALRPIVEEAASREVASGGQFASKNAAGALEKDWTGSLVYRYLAGQQRLGSDAAASRALAEAGIPGLRYFDEGSRSDNKWKWMAEDLRDAQAALADPASSGELQGILRDRIADLEKRIGAGRTRNVVMFSDDKIKIEGMDGEPVRGAQALPTDIRPPQENLVTVRESNFEHGAVGKETDKPVSELNGGVRMSDPKDRARVETLARKIAAPDGYFERMIVDGEGNVLEGQHRLEAARLLGIESVPVVPITDLAAGYPIAAMKTAIRGAGVRQSDRVSQMVDRILKAAHEEGGNLQTVLDEWEMPPDFQGAFEAGVRAAMQGRKVKGAK